MDDLAALESELMWRRSGWYRHVNHESGALAVFPETARDEAAWEAKAEAEAAETVALGERTRPEPKPLENFFVSRLRRGD